MDLYTILEVDEEEKVDKKLKKTMKKKKRNFKKCKCKKNQKKNKKNKKRNMKNRKRRNHQKRNAKKSSADEKEKKIKKQGIVNVSKGIISMNCLMVLKFRDVKEDRLFLKKKGLAAREQVIWRMKAALMGKMESDIDKLFVDNGIEASTKIKKCHE